MEINVDNLKVSFSGPRGSVDAVKGVSFRIGREKLGIVGESGSGKSLTARSILKLLPSRATLSADRLDFDDIDILRASEPDMRRIRGRRAGLIMQDPKYSLNPVITVGAQIAETWRAHRGGGRREAVEAALDLLDQVKIRDPRRVALAYPTELSGGMGQRVMIAMMLAPDPELLIADEPTSALDVSVQAEILRLLEGLVATRGMSLLLISHDLPLVSRFCDRVLVMYSGKVLEELKASELTRASHPYTRGLLACLPSLSRPRARLNTLERSAAWTA
ncbi:MULTISPECIES: ABC transporter ATP-binding protein [unclassified Caballeronia]|uniref:ABC transporter ATP-binding protein n=1 Tax=unclassified Caballeronia TaxID=2646786 RepID=UPI002027FF69|nr:MULTISPECIES: ABC transporter ATP-binding protein [unclassified Caballeronia]